MLPKVLDKLKKFSELIGNRTSDLPGCRIAPELLICGVPNRIAYCV
jgi:hypothetical protein